MEDVIEREDSFIADDKYEERRFLIDLMVWSFSRLNSFYHCPLEWKLHYLDGEYGVGSGLAQFGSYIHKILEMYFKGELDIFSLPLYYEEHYDEFITLPFPYNNHVDLATKYYEQGLMYFENFNWDLSGYDIIGVEKNIEFEYEGYKFVGFIDLLLRDKRDGKLIICDHKSSSLKFLKSGEISKSDRAHFDEFKKQLLIYSYAIIQEFGEDSVKSLQWNLFRLNKIHTIPWKRKEFEAAMKWAVDTIHTIEWESDWDATPSQFYCRELCSQRDSCIHKE